jgi:hypothetical protein
LPQSTLKGTLAQLAQKNGGRTLRKKGRQRHLSTNLKHELLTGDFAADSRATDYWRRNELISLLVMTDR